MNTDAPELRWPSITAARIRVLEIQAKLHRWANDDSGRQFPDLFNLVYDPAFLLLAWERVRNNKGARSAGVDGASAFDIEQHGVEMFLADVREELKAQRFRPLPVRERMIPKPGTTKRRRLGIPTVRDRVVQGALKLVLEPIFEADFEPCSYGFRPNRRAHDAIAEIRTFASAPHRYEWVVEGDITACFDEISHSALMDRVRQRVSDKRVLALVKAFLKAGILSKEGLRETHTGTPQGGILSPLLANVALSVLDEHFARRRAEQQQMTRRQLRGRPYVRFVRYADDWVALVRGTKADAEALCDEAAVVLSTMGLRLSPEKTTVVHIDEGFVFLGWRIQRHRKRGTTQHYVYTYPSKKAVASVTGKVRTISRMDKNLSLEVLLHNLNPVLQGWCVYFQPGVSSATFHFLRAFVWRRVMGWLHRKHPGATWKELRRRYCHGQWWPTDGETALFDPGRMRTTRYRYRGTAIPTPWASTT